MPNSVQSIISLACTVEQYAMVENVRGPLSYNKAG